MKRGFLQHVQHGLGNARGAACPPARTVAENHRIQPGANLWIRPYAPRLRSHFIRAGRSLHTHRRPTLTGFPVPAY
jgi:hypothetical protein